MAQFQIPTQTDTTVPQQAANLDPTQDPNFNPDQCWFCLTNPGTDAHYRAAVQMLRRGAMYEEQNEKGEMVQKYNWDTVNYPVPRCKGCYVVHQARGFFDALLPLAVLAVTGAFIGWEAYTLDRTPDALEIAPQAAYGMVALLIAHLCNRIYKFAIDKVTAKVDHKRNYPVITKLITDGWMVAPKNHKKIPNSASSRVAIKSS